MKTQGSLGQYRAFINCLVSFALLTLIAITAGCSSGGDDSNDPPPQETEDAEVQAGSIPIVAVFVGQTVTLDGSNSNTKARAVLSYAWSFSYKPFGSEAELQNASSVNPSFVADVKGTYLVQLVVSAGGNSARDVAVVLVSENTDPDNPLPDTGPWNHPGLSSHCAEQCHEGPNRTANPKSGDHMATSNMCQACHSTFAFDPAPYVDHLEVVGVCSECHNGVVAIGKSIFHPETDVECDDCHNTRAFVETNPDGSFDHSGIDRFCSACHNAVVAIGKHDAHINTTAECGYCHTTESFIPSFAADVDHSVIENDCARSGCHSSTAWPAIHPVTDLDCVICHSVLTFVIDGEFNHRAVDPMTQRCDSCHDGVISTGVEAKTDGPHMETNGVDCGACHSSANVPDTGLPSFANAIFDHTAPEVDLSNCGASGCHDADSVTGAYARDITVHVPTDGNDCHICHNPGDTTQGTGSFAYGVFDHNTLDPITRCDSCHNDGVAVGKAGDHILTNEDCRACHGTVTFTDADVDHSIISSCGTDCHNGVVATGKPTDAFAHVPTNDDCSVCHVATDPVASNNSFVPASNFAHQAATIAEGCDTCHNGRYTTSNGTVPGKPRRTHIPTQGQCDTCHTTDTFTVATIVHPEYSGGGCEGCHNGRFTTDTPSILSKSNSNATNGHVPTAQDCDTCHADTNATDWKALKLPYEQHEGITGDCSTCHNGSYESNGALGEADDPTTTPEVHPQLTIGSGGVSTPDCVACHSAPSVSNPDVTFNTRFVDHSDFAGGCTANNCHSGELQYATTDLAHTSPTDGNDCEICHIAGGTWTEAVFAHTPEQIANRTCESCHNGTDATGKQDKLLITGVAHVDTAEDCNVCHNTEAFAGAVFNHQGIETGCVDCHDGDAATGKHNNHVPTNDDCNVCHRTTGFIPGLFAHTPNQISGVSCESCHDGTFATGKVDKTGTPHIQTTQDCGVCHITDTFEGGIFDHSNIGNQTCVSCHNGNDATGQPNGHIDSEALGLDCVRCHPIGSAFLNPEFDHQNIGPIGNRDDGNCRDCHSSGGGATGQPPTGPNGHFDTNVDCDACHTTSGWGDQGTFDHCPGTTPGNTAINSYNQCGDYPGDHVNRSGIPRFACTRCHNTNQANVIRYKDNTNYAPTCAGCHANDYDRGEGDHRGISRDQECGNTCHNGEHTVRKSSFG